MMFFIDDCGRIRKIRRGYSEPTGVVFSEKLGESKIGKCQSKSVQFLLIEWNVPIDLKLTEVECFELGY